MKRSVLLLFAGALLVVLGCWARGPLRSAFVTQTVRLPGQTSFRVVDIAQATKGSDGKWIEIYCYRKGGEPSVDFLSSTERFSAGMSPISSNYFTIHIPVREFPRVLSMFKIPIAFKGTTGVSRAEIDLRMWARDGSQSIPAGLIN
jgi:hypothetical protein